MEKKHSITIELVVGLLTVSFLIYALRSMLIFGETTLLHDNVLWRFPTFHFFTENIMNGHYPLWNPFSHGGEPFYPLLMVSGKLFDPLTLAVIYLIQFFSDDIFLLFNWNHFILSLIMLFGVYILLRPVAKHLFIRLTLIVILPYSSFMLCSFRQPGFIFMFVWATYTLYFLLRIVYYKDYRWHNWLFFSAFAGLNCQAYLFVGIGMFLLFFIIGILVFRRDLLKALLQENKIAFKFAAACIITLTMMMPNIVLMSEKDNYVYPARMVDKTIFDGTPQYAPMQTEGTPEDIVKGINMSYRFISHTGTFSTIWDFIQTISPEGNYFISNEPGKWGKPSEAYMYLGLLPWAVALLGMVTGRHGLKKVFLFILLAFGLLMLGPAGGLHRCLYYIYPPLWFIRHTHSLVLFFLLAFLYFYVLGMNSIISKLEHAPFSNNINYHGIIAAILFSVFFVCLVFWMTQLKYPFSNYLFVFIFLIIAVGWRLRHELGKTGLYISLIASHIILVLIFYFEPMLFIKKVVLFTGLPLALFLLIK